MITDSIWSQSRLCQEAEAAHVATLRNAPKRPVINTIRPAPRKKREGGPRGLVGRALQVVRSMSPAETSSQDIVMVLGINKVPAANILQNLYLNGHIIRVGRGRYLPAD